MSISSHKNIFSRIASVKIIKTLISEYNGIKTAHFVFRVMRRYILFLAKAKIEKTFIRNKEIKREGVKMVDYTALGLAFVVNIIVYTIVLHIATMISKVEGATITKALTVAVIAALIGLILSLGTTWGGLIALIIAIAIIKYVYGCDWTKALFTWIIYIVLAIIIGLILGAIGLAVFMAM